MRPLALALLALACGWPTLAGAHARASSHSEWTLTPEGAQAQARVTALELTRLHLHPAATADYAARAGALLAQRLQLRAGGETCAPQGISAQLGADGWLRARWTVRCASDAERGLRSGILAEVAPGHLHFARVSLPGGAVRERVLTASEPDWALPARDPGSLRRYVALGVDHILSGWDHLAFVLALLLLARSLRELAVVATGFTLAHSLTLAAAVLGLVQARVALVEALVGFTIAVAAVEVAWSRAARPRWMPLSLVAVLALATPWLPLLALAGLAAFTLCYFALLDRAARPARLRLAMATLFGLIHGFGFAAALIEMELPRERLAAALLGFNAGVELGQLLVIALAWPVLRLLARRPPAFTWLHEGAAAGLAGLGLFWFIARSVG